MNNRIKMTDSKFKCNIFLFLSVTVFMARLSIYHLHFIPVAVAEASQIFLRDAHILPKYCGRDKWSAYRRLIAVYLRVGLLGVSAVNPLVAFYDIHGRKREPRCCSFILSRKPHETIKMRIL
jgi:hypothetical protein